MDNALTMPPPAALAEAEAAPALPLAARIEAINTLAARAAVAEERARAAGQQAWQLGVMLGHALCTLKAEVGHGNFKPLFKNHSKSATCGTFEMPYRTASRYMSLYKDAEAWCKRHSLSMCGGTLPAEADIPAGLSMRGAMQLFAEAEAPAAPARPAPTFSAPNTAGRVRKDEGKVSEQERVEAPNKAADAELWALLHRLEEFFSSGRHTRVNATTRQAAEAVFRVALNRLKEVN